MGAVVKQNLLIAEIKALYALSLQEATKAASSSNSIGLLENKPESAATGRTHLERRHRAQNRKLNLNK
jgi:hypothetical protein